jgi:CHAT domain-containing protein/Tfp pilus assembly protein PilF
MALRSFESANAHRRISASTARRFAACGIALMTVASALPSRAQQPTAVASSQAAPVLAPQVAEKLNRLQSDLKAAQLKHDAKAQAKTLNAIGDLYFGVSVFPPAIQNYSAAFEQANASHDPTLQAAALNGQGLCYVNLHQNDKAHDAFQRELDLATSSADLRGQSAALDGLGFVAMFQGRYADDLQQQNRALPLAQQANDRSIQARILHGTALAQYALADYKSALDSLNKSVAISLDTGDREAEGKARVVLSAVEIALGDKTKSIDEGNQAAAIFHGTGDYHDEATALFAVATICSATGLPQQALEDFNHSLVVYRQIGEQAAEVGPLKGIAGIYVSQNEYAKALDAYSQALPILRKEGDRGGEAVVLQASGETYLNLSEPQKALDVDNQALAIYRDLKDQGGEAGTLLDLGLAYFRQLLPRQALEQFNLALPLFEQLKDQADQARALLDIGSAYTQLGEPLKALDFYNQALPIQQAKGDGFAEARNLCSVGAIYASLGEEEKALDFYNRALPIFKQTNDLVGEANTLIYIGGLRSAQGDQHKALELYGQALAMLRQTGDLDGEVGTLGAMGWSWSALDEEQKAMDAYSQAQSIFRQKGNTAGIAIMQALIGSLYAQLNEPQKALDAYNQALPILHQAGLRDTEEWVLYAIGRVFSVMDEKPKALDYYKQALQTFRDVHDRHGEAAALMSIGRITFEIGNNQSAQDYLNQALAIWRDVGDRGNEAETLFYLASTYSSPGDHQRALDALHQALPLAAAVDDPNRQALILDRLLLLTESDQPGVAIYYGKQGVNLVQQARTNIKDMDKTLQQSFMSVRDDDYHDLATLLIAQGRLPEAQQVLDLLKQQEYTDYVRGDASNNLGALTLTPAEQQAADDYQTSTSQIVALGEQWAALKKVPNRTADQEKEYQQLSAQLDTSSKGLNDYYGRLYKLFSTAGDANKQVADVKGDVSLLKQAIAKMPHTVALYTLVGSDRYSVIVITGSTAAAREYPIAEKDLNQKIAAFEQALRDPHSDPKPIAEALYKILISPVKKDLDQAQAQTLVWSLDGVLRYVPIAALYDGKQYAVENYSIVTITPVSIPHLTEKPDFTNLSAVAMGISRQYESTLPALPAVAGELDNVISDAQNKNAQGVLPGTILLNGAFTEKAMEQALDNPHTVVHIASHFVFRPGDDSRSYLLLAGKDQDTQGYHLTVADFRDNQQITLTDTDLLTLSACETGMSGNTGDGREVDGLGTTAQLKGAKAVISSLWEVDDASTGALMADFYKRWADGAGKVAKVDALRAAQMDLLRNKIAPQSGAAGRGFSTEGSSPAAPASSTSYAHPYYWAPFVLMGNWR